MAADGRAIAVGRLAADAPGEGGVGHDGDDEGEDGNAEDEQEAEDAVEVLGFVRPDGGEEVGEDEELADGGEAGPEEGDADEMFAVQGQRSTQG
nr:hypothetical protein [Tepidiforma sp.]